MEILVNPLKGSLIEEWFQPFCCGRRGSIEIERVQVKKGS